MTILKTITGQEIDTAMFDGKGYGEFTRFMQKNIDSKWGKNDTTPTKYKVELLANKMVEVASEVEVEANTEEEARQLALQQAHSGELYWENTGDGSLDDIEVDCITLIDDEEN